METFSHKSVLLNETIDGLNIKPDGLYLDGTVGGGGHSYEIAKRLTTGRLVCIDQDEDALRAAKKKLKEYEDKTTFIRGNFKNMKELLMPYGLFGFDGIMLDIGVSSYQIDEKSRGFTIRDDAPLDMRMDRRQSLTAEEIVNEYSLEDLTKIFFEYGEERFSKKIAQNIVDERLNGRITSTNQLNDIIKKSVFGAPDKKTKSLLRIYQALRIEVNDELNALQSAIEDAFFLLKSGGRLAIISFHSLEDRIVKNAFRYYELDCICDPKQPVCTCDKEKTGNVITRKPITASKNELKENSRAHSAKLRIIEKI